MLSRFFGVYIAQTREQKNRRRQASQIELAEPFEYSNIEDASSTPFACIRRKKSRAGWKAADRLVRREHGFKSGDFKEYFCGRCRLRT